MILISHCAAISLACLMLVAVATAKHTAGKTDNGKGKQEKRQVVASTKYLWPNGTVLIVFANDSDQYNIAFHELLHALGVFHEHQRPDRDQHVTINVTNIEKAVFSLIRDLCSVQSPACNQSNVPYDVTSVMHYTQSAGAVNLDQPTIIARNAALQNLVGTGLTLTQTDWKKLNDLYCNDSCPDQQNSCGQSQSNGYVNPNNCSQCFCADGLEEVANNCTKAIPDFQCGKLLNATAHWQTLTFQQIIVFPNEPQCTYVIEAPAGQTVTIQGTSDFISSPLNHSIYKCGGGVLEVRTNTADLSLPEYGFCGMDMSNMTFTSTGHRALVIHRYDGWDNITDIHVKYMITPDSSSSTTTKEPPTDENTNCGYYVSLGGCEIGAELYDFMMFYCPKTCASLSVCKDEGLYCSDWASNGHCTINPKYMNWKCKKSCNKC